MIRYVDIMIGWRCRAACLMIAALLNELLVIDASAQTAEARASLCFDIINTRTAAQMEGSILLNRCTGQTWLLTRSARRGGALSYRWNLLAADGGEISKPLPPEVRMPTPVWPSSEMPALVPPSSVMPAPARPGTEKCFTFQGRQFCE
jgi:hypothetical protein